MTVAISPIQSHDLAEVGQFLHEQLNNRFSAEMWISSLTHRWAADVPNHGMQLRDGDRLVGVFCAIYSDQIIEGRQERFCNPHSWCVLASHRQHGIGLLLKLIKQPNYHFTMFTPNPKVAKVFLGLKFENLDDRQYISFNPPSPAVWRSGAFVIWQPDLISARLAGQDLQDFEAHRDFPWLRFVAFGAGDDVCWVIYKPSRWKRLPSAWILHVSNAEAFARHDRLLRNHLVTRHGMVTMRLEARMVSERPDWSLLQQRNQPKLLKSSSLSAAQVRDLYSELMALDV